MKDLDQKCIAAFIDGPFTGRICDFEADEFPLALQFCYFSDGKRDLIYRKWTYKDPILGKEWVVYKMESWS